MPPATATSLTAPQKDSPVATSLLLRLAQVRFFTFSLLLHVGLVLLGGSAVLFHAYNPVSDFIAGEGGLVATSSDLVAPPDLPVVPETLMPDLAPASSMAAPPITALTATTALPSAFELRASPSARIEGIANNLGSAGLGLDGGIASLGKGSGMRGGTGRFFGTAQKTPGLVGTFYDLKQTRAKKPSGVSVADYGALVRKFVGEGWRESQLHEFFKAPKPVYATQIFIPDMAATEGPKAFDMEKEVEPSHWLVHYKARVSPPRDGTFRFVGAGDDFLAVRFNGKLVLDHGFARATDWQAGRFYDYGWTGVPKGFARGETFKVKAGQLYEMEVLIGEQPGGKVFFCLMLEDQAVDYARDKNANPILPVFRLSNEALPALQKGQTLPPFDPEGPVWKAASLKTGTGTDFTGLFEKNK